MYYSYDILYSVIFLHDYFRDRKLVSFTVFPSAGTAEGMKKDGLLFKSQPDGFTVLYDRHYGGRTRTKKEILSSDTEAEFYIKNNDAFLFNYTGGLEEYKIKQSCFLFTNAPDRKGNRLHINDYAGKEDLYPAKEPIPKAGWQQPFGIIRLSEIKSTTYLISFEAKATYWRYILVSDASKELQQPAIIDKANKIVFTGPLPVVLPDKKEAVAFTSQSRLSLSYNPAISFRLVENYNAGTGKYKVVLPQLPYPDIKHISAIGKPAKKESHADYSYIII